MEDLFNNLAFIVYKAPSRVSVVQLLEWLCSLGVCFGVVNQALALDLIATWQPTTTFIRYCKSEGKKK
jgi:hypothetical protein